MYCIILLKILITLYNTIITLPRMLTILLKILVTLYNIHKIHEIHGLIDPLENWPLNFTRSSDVLSPTSVLVNSSVVYC